ncbi:disks large-associated protein 5 isoform X2 [Boleophthalmus pectinirostris]|uniref:disks large-associated protein 5 isoform X2 n=1 Tax=Boleophthalmus pectinirostris TaxID=150288 RepID=UPI00242E751B|nr:disks large-associated protein 5 isoform X2 [Boleophthalmus pectinirostris]
MASRFAHLRQRDNSVSMLRVKMSRRRSQSQKENRERIVNNRRQLDALQELEISALDASVAMANMSVIQEKKKNTPLPKNVAGEDRLKQLQRWQERKALEKEKEQREKARKGVFKTGLYRPKDALNIVPLPPVPAAPGRSKETKTHVAPAQCTRVTRSMRQQQPLNMQDINAAGKKSQPPLERATRNRVAPNKPAQSLCKTKVELATRGLSTRSANKPPVTAAPVVKDKPKDKCADVRTTRSKEVEVATPLTEEKIRNVKNYVPEESISKPEIEKEQRQECPRPTLQTDEEEMVVDQTVPAPALDNEDPKSLPKAPSFAPEGFLFQAPNGLSSIKFEPLTPRSADAFLTPSSSFTLPPAPTFDEPKSEKSKVSPPKSPRRSPLSGPTTVADTQVEEETKHDVPYFRSEITNETNRLTGLCTHWESKVEDESIPEEMRDRMRTAVGQARLLMKERFKQFSGLVDDCDFGRGEKITTCTDLQGFWDMVYFQVEDVNKKFDALKEAEVHSWVEEHKPVPRQRKVVKKPAAAPVPSKPAGTKAAAKSRLAAAKAAMKARQQAAESERTQSTEQTSDTQSEAQSTDTVVFKGGSFQDASPAKLSGSVRRSSRLNAAVLPQPSPSSNCLTPRRVTRRSLVLAQTPGQTRTMQQPMTTPPAPYPVTKTPAPVEQSLPVTPQPQSTVSVCLCFSSVKEVSSDPIEQSKDLVSEGGHPIPSITVEEQEGLAEHLTSELIQGPQLPHSSCKSPVECAAPMPTSLSFTLSPCTAQLSSPAVSCTPRAVQNLLNTQDSVAVTPDSSVTEDIGVDFERYLQPSLRDSLSPRQPFSMESPMAMDVDLESPRGQAEDSVNEQDAVFTSLPTVPTLLSTESPQTVESALLLFTPDLKNQIRQSVCPSDLMVFTPPHL